MFCTFNGEGDKTRPGKAGNRAVSEPGVPSKISDAREGPLAGGGGID